MFTFLWSHVFIQMPEIIMSSSNIEKSRRLTAVQFSACSIKGNLSIVCQSWLFSNPIEKTVYILPVAQKSIRLFLNHSYWKWLMWKSDSTAAQIFFLPAASSSSCWGASKSQSVLDLSWGLLPVTWTETVYKEQCLSEAEFS